MPAYLGRVKRSFRSYHNEHNSVKDTGEKGKKSVTLTWKFPWKSGSTTQLPLVSSNPKILKAFQKKFRRLVWPRLRFFIRFHYLWVIERLSLIMLHWNLVSFSFFDIREIWDSSIALRSSTPNFFAVSVFFEFVKNRKRWLWKPFDYCCGFLVASETNIVPDYNCWVHPLKNLN